MKFFEIKAHKIFEKINSLSGCVKLTNSLRNIRFLSSLILAVY